MEWGRWLSTAQLTRYLCMSRETIKRLEHAGRLPKPVGPSTRLARYDRVAVDEAMRNALASQVGATAASAEPDADAITREMMNEYAAQRRSQGPKANQRRA